MFCSILNTNLCNHQQLLGAGGRSDRPIKGRIVSVCLCLLAFFLSIFPVSVSAQVSVVDRTSSSKATTSSARATCYDTKSETHWAFWYTGTQIEYASSSDTDVWTNKGSLPYNSSRLSVACRVFGESSLVFVTTVTTSGEVVLSRGTIAHGQLNFENGIIVFDAPGAGERYVYPHIALDNIGRVWIAAFLDLGPKGDRFQLITRRTSQSGENSIAFNQATRLSKPSASVSGVSLAALQGDSMLAVVSGESGNGVVAYQFDGNTWSLAGSGGEYRASLFSQGGLNQTVSAVAVLDDTVYVGGAFNRAGGNVANYIAKWDGESWSDVGGGVNGNVFKLVISGTDLYVAGSFTSAGGIAANRIAKWDGANWSTLGTGLNGFASELFMVGGDLYVAGGFSEAGGIPANKIAKWDGSAWSALGSGLNGNVSALTSADGIIYAGGIFTSAGGSPASNIAAWNGFTWSALGSGINGQVFDLATIGSDLFAAGSFSTAGGVTANCLARWRAGSWSPVDNSPIARFDNSVSSLAVDGNDLYVAGYFSSIAFAPFARIAKWDGISWSSLGTGISGNTAETITVVGKKLYVGGSFASAGGSNSANFASWNLESSTWSGFGSGVNGIIYSMAFLGSDLYVGGTFTSLGSTAARYIARWSGSKWNPVGGGVNAPVRTVKAIGTDLYVGGSFTTAGDTDAPYIAKWDGNSWSGVGGGTDGQVLAIENLNGEIFVGGSFLKAGGITVNSIAKWNGRTWNSLGTGTNQTVSTIAASGNTLYVGGLFTSAGGNTFRHIASWNGTSWSGLGSGLSQQAWIIKPIGTNIYVGGGFTTAGGKSINYIASWDGNSWRGLGTGTNNWVYGIDTIGTDILATGAFTTAGGNAAKYIARWDGTKWNALGDGSPTSIWSVAVSGMEIYTGGQSPALFQRGVANDQFPETVASLVSGASGSVHLAYIDTNRDIKLRSFQGSPLSWTTARVTYTGSVNSLALSFAPTTSRLINWFIDSGRVWRHDATSPFTTWSSPEEISSQGQPRSIDADRAGNWRGHTLAIWTRANSSNFDLVASLGLNGASGLPTDTPTATPTFTATNTHTATATFTSTPESTPTPPPAPTPTPGFTPSPQVTPTNTPSPIFPSYSSGTLTISGQVVDESDQPVANVLVYSTDLGVASTNSKGEFALRGARAGFDYQLFARRVGITQLNDPDITRTDRLTRIIVRISGKSPSQCPSRDISRIILRAGTLASRLYSLAMSDLQLAAKKKSLNIPTSNMTKTHALLRRYIALSINIPDLIYICPQSIKAISSCSIQQTTPTKVSLLALSKGLRSGALLGNRLARESKARGMSPSLARIRLVRAISEDLNKQISLIPPSSDLCVPK